MKPDVLRVRGLQVYYHTPLGAVKAAEDISFSLKAEERLGLVGESGSGKSTLALAILRMIKPPGRIEAGEVWLDGQNVMALSEEEMRRVLEIEPAYDKGGADRVLGRVYHEVPGIFGGSEQKSLEHLRKAVEYGPRVGLNLLYLADTYISLDQIDKARQTLEYILTMEPEPDLIPETEEERVQARQKLEGKPFKKK